LDNTQALVRELCKSDILIVANDFELIVLTVILFIGRQQIEKGEPITFSLNQMFTEIEKGNNSSINCYRDKN